MCEVRAPVEHDLKCWPPFFDEVERGTKPFELRKHDRDFKVGDTLLLREFVPSTGYTGRDCRRFISYMLAGPWLAEGYVALGLTIEAEEEADDGSWPRRIARRAMKLSACPCKHCVQAKTGRWEGFSESMRAACVEDAELHLAALRDLGWTLTPPQPQQGPEL